MTDLTSLTLAEARDRLKSRAMSSLEITKAHLEAIERAKALNAFIATTADKALEMAEASDVRLAKGEGGPARGAADRRQGSLRHPRRAHAGLQPHPRRLQTALRIDRHRQSVARRRGDARQAQYGRVRHGIVERDVLLRARRFALAAAELEPRPGASGAFAGKRGLLTPGGSSGGSASAVAARLCLAATASDTGGSIRQPAAFTGIVGIKPTYGRCSRYGMVAFASSLDQAGPLARTVRDAAIMLRSMAGPDAKDSTCSPAPVPDYEAAVGRSVKGMKIGVPKEYRLDGMNSEIEALWTRGAAWLRAAGASVVDVSLPHTPYALPAYYIVAPAEASSNLARYDGVRYGLREPAADIVELYEKTRAKGFGAEVRRRLMIGTYVLSAGYYDAYYVRAQKIRTLIKRDFERAFADGVDAILTPATPSAAFGIGEKGAENPVEMYLNDVFTVTVNMAGLPGLVAPAGLSSDGLPLGLQLIGRPFDEETLFALGETIEQSAGRTRLPDAWWA